MVPMKNRYPHNFGPEKPAGPPMPDEVRAGIILRNAAKIAGRSREQRLAMGREFKQELAKASGSAAVTLEVGDLE